MSNTKCVLSYTDGYELSMRVFDSYDAAVKTIKDEYTRCADNQLFSEDDSYLDETSAKCVIEGEDIFLWELLVL